MRRCKRVELRENRRIKVAREGRCQPERECRFVRMKRECEREKKRERKLISIHRSGGRLAGFRTGDAIESDTSTRHSRNTLALILISVFLVGG